MQDRFRHMSVIHRVSEMLGKTIRRLEVIDAQGFITPVERKIFVYRERESDDAPEAGELMDSYYLLPPYSVKGVSFVMLKQIATGAVGSRYEITIRSEEVDIDLYPFLEGICKIDGAPSISRIDEGYEFRFPITLTAWNQIREKRTVVEYEIYELITLAAHLGTAETTSWEEITENGGRQR